MAGIELSLGNVFSFISYISPFIVAFIVIIISFLNQNVKGIIYLGGVLIVSIVTMMLQKVGVQFNITPTIDENKALFCSIFDYGGLSSIRESSFPPFNSILIIFTITYMIMPMYMNNGSINMPFTGFLLFLYFLDMFIKVNNGCTSYIGALIGGVLGYLMGNIYFSLIKSSGGIKFLYFNELTQDEQICKRVTQKKFKCKVYKNGKILTEYDG